MDGYTYGEGGRTNALQAPINRLVTMTENAIIHQHIVEDMKNFLTPEQIEQVGAAHYLHLAGIKPFDVNQFNNGDRQPSLVEYFMIKVIEQSNEDRKAYAAKCETNRQNIQKRWNKPEEAPAPTPAPSAAPVSEVRKEDEKLILELMVYCITMQWSDPYKKACAAVEYNNRTEWKKLQPGQRKYDYCKGYFTLKGYDKDKPSPYGPLLHLLVMREIGMSRESIRIVSEGISGMDRVGDTLLVNTKSPEASSILQAVMLDDTKKAYILQHYKASIPYKDIKIA